MFWGSKALKFVLWVALIAATYFGLPIPKNWTDLKAMMIAAEAFIDTHAAFPSLFALAVGLMCGAAIIPDIWRVIKLRFFPEPPRPDMSARIAFSYLMIKSKWSINKEYLSQGPRFLEEDIEIEIRNACAQERVFVWGETAGSSVLDSTQVKIPASEWRHIGFDLTRMFSDLPTPRCASTASGHTMKSFSSVHPKYAGNGQLHRGLDCFSINTGAGG
jgi:hypothetical protein